MNKSVIYVDSQGVEHLALTTKEETDVLNNTVYDLFVYDIVSAVSGVVNETVVTTHVNCWKELSVVNSSEPTVEPTA